MICGGDWVMIFCGKSEWKLDFFFPRGAVRAECRIVVFFPVVPRPMAARQGFSILDNDDTLCQVDGATIIPD